MRIDLDFYSLILNYNFLERPLDLVIEQYDRFIKCNLWKLTGCRICLYFMWMRVQYIHKEDRSIQNLSSSTDVYFLW